MGEVKYLQIFVCEGIRLFRCSFIEFFAAK